MRIVYANVQGKIGSGRKQVWENIMGMCAINKWDLVVFVETHLREGNRKANIPGYSLFEMRRQEGQKKEGGIAIWARKELEVYEWQRDRPPEGPESSYCG